MSTLISCVGDTDPIRNHHDGALLHIARVLKPAKIVIIHSEHSKKRHEVVIKALQSISDYEPEIEVDNTIISDDNIFRFDKVFSIISNIIWKYAKTEDEIILNLTSSTPQVISAMFSMNRISDLNVHAYQVATPIHGSNEKIGHDNDLPIEQLIAENEDNQSSFENRLIEDEGASFQQMLLRKTFLDLIDMYDYEGALSIIKNNGMELSKRKRANIRKRLESISHTLKAQKFLPEIRELTLTSKEKRLINAYLIIDLQIKRKLSSETIIRVKNFTEKITEFYLDINYPNLIVYDKKGRPFFNSKDNEDVLMALKLDAEKSNRQFNEEDWLSLPKYRNILRILDKKNPMLKALNYVNDLNDVRNNVAHGFKEVDEKRIDLKKLDYHCQQMLLETIDCPTDKYFNYYDTTNQNIRNYMNG